MREVAVLLWGLTLLRFVQMSVAREVIVRPEKAEDFTGAQLGELICLPDLQDAEEHPDFEWIRPQFSTFKTRDYLKNNNILQSNSVVSRLDKGNYTCTATFANGTRISQKFVVCVTLSSSTKSKPVGGSISEETYVPVGHSVTLECKAAIGTPRCANPFNYTLTWSKESRESGKFEQLTSSEEIDITEPEVVENGLLYGKLIIKEVKSSYYGTYLCIITNENGSLNQTVNVTDKVPWKILKEHQLWIACGLIICITFIPFWIYGLQHSRANIKFFLRSLRANPSITASVCKVLPEKGKFPLLSNQKEDGDKTSLLGCVLVGPS